MALGSPGHTVDPVSETWNLSPMHKGSVRATAMTRACVCLLVRSYEIKEVDGVKQPPVKVGSGVTNAQGVFLVNGPWVAGDHTIVVDSAPNFVKPGPLAVRVFRQQCHSMHSASAVVVVAVGILVGGFRAHIRR
jgi:hypothetical protein